MENRIVKKILFDTIKKRPPGCWKPGADFYIPLFFGVPYCPVETAGYDTDIRV